MKRRFSFIVSSTLLLFFAASARAQDRTGPLAPPPKYEVKRIPSEPHPGPPPCPQQEIIQKLAANDAVMKQKTETYDFTHAIRIEDVADPAAKWSVTGAVYTRPDGPPSMRVAQ